MYLFCFHLLCSEYLICTLRALTSHWLYYHPAGFPLLASLLNFITRRERIGGVLVPDTRMVDHVILLAIPVTGGHLQ